MIYIFEVITMGKKRNNLSCCRKKTTKVTDALINKSLQAHSASN